MLITEIYTKFYVPKNLQEHMLRVAALGKSVTDNWQGKSINQSAVIEACLLHDIAKPMSFDLSGPPRFGMTATDHELLKLWQMELKTRYGVEEHPAMIKICREVGCLNQAVRVAHEMEWYYLDRLMKTADFEALIAVYGDMRIGPSGLMALTDRVTELRSRTKVNNFDHLIKAGIEAEQVIQKNCRTDLQSITDNDLVQLFNRLSAIKIG